MINLVVLVEFEILGDKFDAFCSRVAQQARDSVQLEEGCHQFDVVIDRDGHKVLLYEVYASASAFSDHLLSDQFMAFDAEVKSWVSKKTVRQLELMESVR